MTTAATGKDTIVLNDGTTDIVLNDFGDGDVMTLVFPNEEVAVKTGKNGNSIYAFNETGRQVDVELRILQGSSDDKTLNSLKLAMENDFPSFPFLSLNLTKRVGDGKGNIANVVYSMEGGIFSQGVDTKVNVEGDTEAVISVYKLKFVNNKRTI